MAAFTSSHRFGFLLICILFSVPVSHSQTDLTGAWQDDNGGVYCVTQTGDHIFWYMDNRPEVHNVFYGIVADDHIAGRWSDLPGGELHYSGTLALRIESSDRLIKLDESRNYGGSLWKRIDDAVCNDCVTGDPVTGVPPLPPDPPPPFIEPGGGDDPDPTPDECPCGIGTSWHISFQIGNYWGADWTRRGNSNVFDMNARTAAASMKYVMTVNVNGKDIQVTGIDPNGKNPVTWVGKVGGERECEEGFCCSISGSWWWDRDPDSKFQWQGYMVCGEDGGRSGQTGIEGGQPEPPVDECPCGVGQEWYFTYMIGNDWTCRLTRKGNSNVFESYCWTGAASGKGLMTFEVNGKEFVGYGTDPNGKSPSTWVGTIGEEVPCEEGFCCAVTGSWYMNKSPGQKYNFRGRVLCSDDKGTGRTGSGNGGKGKGPGTGGGITELPGGHLPNCGVVDVPKEIPPATIPEPYYIDTRAVCDNPRTQAVMDYWLAKARPYPVEGLELCFEEWGRTIDVSDPTHLTRYYPPTTSKSRCEWLWEDSEGANIMDDAQGILGPFHIFVLENIWRK